MGWSERRAQRRWVREMNRDLRDLERQDRGFETELGQPHVPLAAPRRPPKPRKPRKQRGAALPGLLIVALVLGGVFLLDPSASGQRLRELVGLDGRLGELVGIPDGGGEYAFSVTQPGSDDPVSWNPCRTIRYVVNPDGAPDGWEDLVEDSVQAVSDATGFEFEDEGVTDDRSFESRRGGLGARAPVLIGWADADEVAGLAGDVAGLGGAAAVETSPRHLTFVTGMAVLDTEVYDDLERERGGEDLMRAILMHELAHVVGLDHVDDRDELMNEDNVGQTEFGEGDLEGLARLGGVDCG